MGSSSSMWTAGPANQIGNYLWCPTFLMLFLFLLVSSCSPLGFPVVLLLCSAMEANGGQWSQQLVILIIVLQANSRKSRRRAGRVQPAIHRLSEHTHTLTVCKTLMTLVMLWLEKKEEKKKGKRCFALHCCRWLLDNSKRTNATSGQRAYWDGHRHEEHAGPMECAPPPTLPLSSSALVPTTHPQKCSSEELKS